MKQIEFETKNKETSLALRGPMTESLSDSVTQSVKIAYVQDKINDQKKDKVINVIDSLLRRNREGDDDDVLIDDDMAEVITKEVDDCENFAGIR